MSTEPARHTNRLAHETSPYLLQHAKNPVDWYPWGAAALERARRENKPILLSIGYAACHWCHVMERESFENDAIAQLMNAHFVCIKVDREERPDLDEIYMAATVAISGSGGWPMTVFLTPDQKPFFAGTYFPPVDKYGRPGFETLLVRIARLWDEQRGDLVRQATELTEEIRGQSAAVRPAALNPDAISSAVRQLSASFDPRWGGFGQAPKFPPPAALSLLLRHHQKTGDAHALEMVRRTLDGMKNGGIYDQLGGGFARYSTDEKWLVPHFEKMLYDNAQLARVYLEAWQVTKDAEYRRIAVETLDYVLREMQGPAGGYYSATDADSEGEEGRFFVFTLDQIVEVLGSGEAERFSLYYDVTPHGNWEDKNILNVRRSLADCARELGISEQALGESLASSKHKLYEARKQRIPPLLDDKVLVSWNALMIGAMADGHRVVRDRRYLESAERAARFVTEHLRRPDGGLYRTARDGRAHLDAYLEDYAYLCDALVDLYEAGGSLEWLHEASRLAERMIVDFGDSEDGAFFFTAKTHEALLIRTREGNDGALPNPNAVAARALARLSAHFDREPLRERAERAIEAYGRLVERAPRAFATTLSVLDLLLEPPIELVIVGEPSDARTEALFAEVAKHYLPNRIVGHLDPTAAPPPETSVPLVEGKGLVRGLPALYICRNFVCASPIGDVADVARTLTEERARSSERRTSSLGGRNVPGLASASGTAAYASRYGTRHGPSGYATLGQTGWIASRIGFGGYRIDESDEAHRAALSKALREGANLIDTSTNYTDGSSERLIGQVLGDLIRRGELAREEVIVVSKIGYVQGRNLEIAEARKAEGKPVPEMVHYGEGIWHCMHPEWLDDQLTRSLGRLGLQALDVCLVHNPEYFFSDAIKRGQGPLAALRDEFYARLGRAFAHFEREVERGRIGCYGVSSNSAVVSADDREATDLTRMLDAAKAAAGAAHHFRVLELPMNLVESGALFGKNDAARTRSVLEIARAENIAVLVNRPLNAIVGEGLLRLADPTPAPDAPPFDAQLARVANLEEEFRRSFAPMIRTAPGSASPQSLFAWADQLEKLRLSIDSLEQWREIEERAIAPRVAYAVQALDQTFQGQHGNDWRNFRDRYLPELETLLLALQQRAFERSQARSRAITAAIDPWLPEARRKEPLSQKALWALKSVPGVTTVLVGMRRPDYVEDALAIMGAAPLENPERLFSAVSNARIPGV